MPADEAETEKRWVATARLLRPQGRKGEILAEPLTDLPGVFAKDQQFRLVADGQSVASAPGIILEDCWWPQGRNAGRLVLKLAGIDSINAAEALEAKELFLSEVLLPLLEEGTFFVRDLIGCTLFDGARPVGTVVELEFPIAPDGRTRLADAVDLLVVAPVGADPDTEPTMVPFVKAWLSAVDLQAKRITMHLPPGLFDPVP